MTEQGTHFEYPPEFSGRIAEAEGRSVEDWKPIVKDWSYRELAHLLRDRNDEELDARWSNIAINYYRIARNYEMAGLTSKDYWKQKSEESYLQSIILNLSVDASARAAEAISELVAAGEFKID